MRHKQLKLVEEQAFWKGARPRPEDASELFNLTNIGVGDYFYFYGRSGEDEPKLFEVIGVYASIQSFRRLKSAGNRHDYVRLRAVDDPDDVRFIGAQYMQYAAAWHRVTD